MSLDTPNQDWFHDVDGIVSLVASRHSANLPADLVSNLKTISADARRFAQNDRYVGGFPITLGAMVAHAKAHGRTDELLRLITADEEL